MKFTPEETAAMAKEAGARSEHWATRLFPAVQFLFTPDDLSRFAALVAEKAAAKERHACEALCQRRADVCEAHSEVIRKAQGFTQAWEWVRATARASQRCASAIRARSQKEGA